MRLQRSLRSIFGLMMFAAVLASPAVADHLKNEPTEEAPRRLYVFPGDYGETVQKQKEDFKSRFGYELIDGDGQWRPEEIEKLAQAFSQLPDHFYGLGAVRGFYRVGHFLSGDNDQQASDIPAATFPQIHLVYRHAHQAYRVEVSQEPLRIEFFNPLFYEEPDDFENIVQHEMAHLYDTAHGFLSFSREWLELTRFRLVHLPALDAKPDSDFLYKWLSDPGSLNHAPVADRNLITYSRETPQEDFANSVTAYRHYPYFRFSDPERYRFLRDRVFRGREYFSETPGSADYADRILSDFDDALKREDWARLIAVVREGSRIVRPDVDQALTGRLVQVLEGRPASSADVSIAVASCFLYSPQALLLRSRLLAEKRVEVEPVFQYPQCRRMGRKIFEEVVVKGPVQELYFMRDPDRVWFLDPMALNAHARNFQTSYVWKLFALEGERLEPLSNGLEPVQVPVNGAVEIRLAETADGSYQLPEGRILLLEVSANRMNMETGQHFLSPPARLRFVVPPGFRYLGPPNPNIQVQFPPGFQPMEPSLN